MLSAQFTSRFERDVKALARKRVDLPPLKGVIDLVLEDTEETRMVLRQRHNMICSKALGLAATSAMPQMQEIGSSSGRLGTALRSSSERERTTSCFAD